MLRVSGRVRMFAAALGAMVAMVATPATASGVPMPAGYGIAGSQQLDGGVEHVTLVGGTPHQSVHVARVPAGAPVALRAVVSGERVADRHTLERTSTMCARVQCIVAINGDYVHPSGEPVGGVVSHGRIARSPSNLHHQLTVGHDGGLAAGVLSWTGTAMTTDLQRIPIHGVNVPREQDKLVLYTPAWGPSTRTNQAGVEIPARLVRRDVPLAVGETSIVRLGEARVAAGDTPIPADGVVLSGHGSMAELLRALSGRIGAGVAGPDILVRIETTPAALESIGGSPVLVREGRRWFQDADTNFVRGRHPRTIVGWTSERDVLLVTVDGRQPGHSAGMTLAEAAELMIGLGAVEAINLDGGGSTAFAVKGWIANRPSDRLVERGGRQSIVSAPRTGDVVIGYVERPVVNALVVVPRTSVPMDTAPLDAIDLRLPQALSLLPPITDPASVIHGSQLPALVPLESGTDDQRLLPAGTSPDAVLATQDVASVAVPGDAVAVASRLAVGATALVALAGALALTAGLVVPLHPIAAMLPRSRPSARLALQKVWSSVVAGPSV